jgi:histidine kinase/DNA gyrase B/HSP90-like ATPase
MAEHKVSLVANEGIFQGLAKQNMLFHQCVGELVDNAISATKEASEFRVEIILVPSETAKDSVDLYIVDSGRGMSLTLLSKALQLGESPTTENRLNEHGFGLKNALATLSGGNGIWKLWTKPANENDIYSVEGPFRQQMVILDKQELPTETFLPADIATAIRVPVKLSFLQSVQGRGAPSKDLVVLREWLIEHLGVLYRGYLELDSKTFRSSGVLIVAIGTDRRQVPPVPVPLGKSEVKYFKVELGGTVYELTYRFGALDEVKRDVLVAGNKAKFYYQGNQPTQGIDIRLGKRAIATRQIETIWKTEDGQQSLSRHNNLNDFLGELLIPEVPRGILTTVNNKTDFNLDDPEWAKIFSKLNEFRPPRQIREKSELELRKRWIAMLKATNPEDQVSDEISVWPTGTAIDVYRKTSHGKIIIYELKAVAGAPINLYQLKMYWDGLVIDKKEQPNEAVLIVEDFSSALEQMANMMNLLSPPAKTQPYNFRIERLRDKGL